MSEESSPDHAPNPSRSGLPPEAGPQQHARLTSVLSAHHLLVSLGLYTAMPVLALVLGRKASGAAGPGLFCYTASAGLGALLVSRWLSRRRYLPTMIAGTSPAAAGFGLLPYADDSIGPLVLLLTAGFGMSLHAMSSRVLVAESRQGAGGVRACGWCDRGGLSGFRVVPSRLGRRGGSGRIIDRDRAGQERRRARS